MQPEIIQANYEELAGVAKRFETCASTGTMLRGRLLQNFDSLTQSGWEGKGVAAFIAEMQGELLPALDRLITALDTAQTVTLEIQAIMQQAEIEASQPFRNQTAVTGADSAGQANASWWSRWGEWVHTALDGVGFIPGVGELADGANAVIYLAEGRYLEATISAAAMIPIIGDAGKVGKLGMRAGKELLEEATETGAKRVLREGAGEIAETGSKRIIREEAEIAGETGGRKLLRFGELEPNTRYVRNGYEYVTDDLGRVSQVRGQLDLKTGVRDPYSQRQVGKQGLPDDHGGHLIGTRFDGTPEGVNVVPQNANLNQGAWKRMENEWERAIKDGKRVEVDITIRYPPNGSMRPSRFEVTTITNDLPQTRFMRNRPGG